MVENWNIFNGGEMYGVNVYFYGWYLLFFVVGIIKGNGIVLVVGGLGL